MDNTFLAKFFLLLGYCLSNHALMLVTYKLKGPQHCPSRYYMNVAQLKEQPLLNKISSMWIQEEARHLKLNTALELQLLQCTKRNLRIVHTYGKQKAKERHALERELCNTLQEAQLACEVNLLNTACQTKLTKAKAIVKAFDAIHANWERSIL